MHRKPYKRSKELKAEANAANRHRMAEEFRDSFYRRAASKSVTELMAEWETFRKNRDAELAEARKHIAERKTKNKE